MEAADLLCELGEDVNEQGLPPGFRFHPTDEELITFYLSSKVFFNNVDNNFMVPRITEVDLNRCEPWDLPEAARTGEREWYLFSLRDRKYPTGLRTNRATGAGYWKATGKDKEVYAAAGGLMIGMKKTLVFYKGRAPRGDKTRWVMHEFRLDGHHHHHHLMSSPPVQPFTEEWVICRVYHKIGDKTKNNPASSALHLRGGGGGGSQIQTNYSWPWGGDHMMLSSANYNNHTNILNLNPPLLFHHPIPPPPDQDQQDKFHHLNKLIRTLNNPVPVALPDPFSMPKLMNNNNNNNDMIQQLLPAAACHNTHKRIVDMRQTNNCMSHQQDLHQAPIISTSTTTTTTVPKQLFMMKTEETTSTSCFTTPPGQLMMQVHPPDHANNPYYHHHQQLFHGNNIIDFGFLSSINDVALTKNYPHFM